MFSGRLRFSGTLIVIVFLNVSVVAGRKVLFLDGRVSLELPDELGKMQKLYFTKKYPHLDPTNSIGFSDATGSISFVLNKSKQAASQAQIDSLLGVMISQFSAMGIRPQGDIKTVKGRKFITMEFTSRAVDSEIYNYMFATDMDGHLIIGTFNCTADYLAHWQQAGSDIFSSVVINEQNSIESEPQREKTR